MFCFKKKLEAERDELANVKAELTNVKAELDVVNEQRAAANNEMVECVHAFKTRLSKMEKVFNIVKDYLPRSALLSEIRSAERQEKVANRQLLERYTDWLHLDPAVTSDDDRAKAHLKEVLNRKECELRHQTDLCARYRALLATPERSCCVCYLPKPINQFSVGINHNGTCGHAVCNHCIQLLFSNTITETNCPYCGDPINGYKTVYFN